MPYTPTKKPAIKLKKKKPLKASLKNEAKRVSEYVRAQKRTESAVRSSGTKDYRNLSAAEKSAIERERAARKRLDMAASRSDSVIKNVIAAAKTAKTPEQAKKLKEKAKRMQNYANRTRNKMR